MKTIAFLGQKTIAERCLKMLYGPDFKNDLKVAFIVSDRAFYEEAVAIGTETPVFVSNAERNEEAIKRAIGETGADTIISVQHPWILSQGVLDAVKGFAFNLHNAKLPEYRGHNTISHAILNGETTYTTTIGWIAEKVDLGNIAYETSLPIEPDDDAQSLYRKTVDRAVENFRRLAEDLASDREIPRRPLEGPGCFYSRDAIHALKEIKNPVDFSEVDKKARAFYFPPHEPAYISLNGTRFHVLKKFY